MLGLLLNAISVYPRQASPPGLEGRSGSLTHGHFGANQPPELQHSIFTGGRPPLLGRLASDARLAAGPDPVMLGGPPGNCM